MLNFDNQIKNMCMKAARQLNVLQSRPLAGYGLPPPRGNFVDYIFLKVQCLASN